MSRTDLVTGRSAGRSSHVPYAMRELTGGEGKGPEEEARAVGTSLTPEFWERFTVLLVVAIAVTVVLGAALDAFVVRLLRRRTHGTPTRQTPHRLPRTPARC